MSTFERVQNLLVVHLGVDAGKVTPHASFIDDLGTDSLDLIELVMAVEEEFRIQVSDSDAEAALTVNDAVRLIDRAVADQ